MTPESKHRRLVGYRQSIQASWSDYEITRRDYQNFKGLLLDASLEDLLYNVLDVCMKRCYPKYPADPLAAALIGNGWSDAPAAGRWN